VGDGSVDDALAVWTEVRTPAAAARVFATLADGVLLLPVRATVVSGQVAGATGLKAEKEAELDVLTVDLPDLRRVLPAFTSADAMRRWRIEARPVRTAVRDACQAVLDEAWAGILVDPGTRDFVLDLSAVRAFAAGFVPVAGDGSLSVGRVAGSDVVPEEAADASPEQIAAMRRALAREPAVGEAWLLRTAPGLEIGLVLRVPLDPAGLATVAQRVGGRLAAAGVDGADRLTVAALDPATAAAAAVRSLRLWP
jgi:SseB protein N-terminal domain